MEGDGDSSNSSECAIKRRRLSPKKPAATTTKESDQSSELDGNSSGTSDSSNSSAPWRKRFVPSHPNVDKPVSDFAALNANPSGSIPFAIPPNDQFEESAILWAIDEHGLQHLKDPSQVVPSPVPSSTSDDSSSTGDEVVPAPAVERTSDYSSSSDDEEHFDFMEAAVAVAIQKKGLLPHTVQMSPNR